jgi:hypothetical protein
MMLSLKHEFKNINTTKETCERTILYAELTEAESHHSV